MRFFLLLIFIFLISCSTGKKVFICGDRECINKKEAEAYFAKNLSLEIKIYKNKEVKTYDLVKLNTDESIKKQTLNNSPKPDLKTLSKKEKELIKKKLADEKKLAQLKKKQEKKRLKDLKKIKKEKILSQKKLDKKRLKEEKKLTKVTKDTIKKEKLVKKTTKETIDQEINNQIVQYEEICSILNKCEIDEISKFLMNIGINKDYPNLSVE
tara:strand:- start:1008 stop:1640 length:633 start_codon:yes stop_codon:yes gene_type:complete